jgi:hypothetical protein
MRTDGRTDRHDEASRRYSQFCERDLKVINVFLVVRFPDTREKRRGDSSNDNKSWRNVIQRAVEAPNADGYDYLQTSGHILLGLLSFISFLL